MRPECLAAIAAARAALEALADLNPSETPFYYRTDLSREMKAACDHILEGIILLHLRQTGLAILSEETGCLPGERSTDLRWVVDPLDGTVNYVRELGPCGVSIALCRGDDPIWGVIGEYPTGNLSWGGVGEGAFRDQQPIRVSNVSKKEEAIICTGFPSRFVFDERRLKLISRQWGSYAKVRMLGSASISLLAVARGAAEVYSERNIMLWDVAAGVAIVRGAGGHAALSEAGDSQSWDVRVSNGLIQWEIDEHYR